MNTAERIKARLDEFEKVVINDRTRINKNACHGCSTIKALRIAVEALEKVAIYEPMYVHNGRICEHCGDAKRDAESPCRQALEQIAEKVGA